MHEPWLIGASGCFSSCLGVVLVMTHQSSQMASKQEAQLHSARPLNEAQSITSH